MSRLDEMAMSAPEPIDAEPRKEEHPARLALQSITIGDLAGFLFKLIIAGIVAAFPFAVVFLIIALAMGSLR